MDFTEFGPTYVSTVDGGVDVGQQADMTAALLAVIEVEDLEATLASVTEAGVAVVRPILSFPGGRRFDVRDPAGNDSAAMQRD